MLRNESVVYAYVAKQAAEGEPGGGGFPAHSELDLAVTVDETVLPGETLGAAANVVADGKDTSALKGYTIRLTAKIVGGRSLQVSKDGAHWADELEYTVTNYTGTYWGFGDDIYLDIDEDDGGETVRIDCAVLNVEPDGWPAGWSFPGPPWPPGWSEETKAEEVTGHDTSIVLLAEVPCSDLGWPNCYRIKNYQDGTVTPCVTCEAKVEGSSPWNGAFDVRSTWYRWRPTGGIGDERSIVDKRFDSPSSYLALAGWWEEPPVCYWLIRVYCAAGENTLMWEGKKEEGQTPAGIYLRTAGCSATPTALEIEECP